MSGHMGASTLADGSSGSCVINSDGVPAGGYVGGETYTIEVSASENSLYKFHSSDGQCLGSSTSAGDRNGMTTFEWLAPCDESVNFYAICSTDYNSLGAATSVAVTKDPTSPTCAPSDDLSTRSGMNVVLMIGCWLTALLLVDRQ